MRIGCLQFAPKVGEVDNNLNRADSVLSKADPDDLDLLVLPQLAFTGYNFKSLQHISPFLEPSGSGITSLWARTVALKYNCTVAVGYPEKVDVSTRWPTGPEYYNSVIVVNGDGDTIANYRKSHLYRTDETWALEGTKGFYEGWISGLGQTSIGICMDLNPYKFRAPWHAFEFAFHVLHSESNLVVLSMAWMTREDGRMFSRMPNEPDMNTLAYWVSRLEPLIRAESTDEIIVVFCNRSGIEDEAVYSGTSAVLGIHDGEVNVYGILGRGEKELLVVNTENPPYAKLVHRPDATSSQPISSGAHLDHMQSDERNRTTCDPRSPLLPPLQTNSLQPHGSNARISDTQIKIITAVSPNTEQLVSEIPTPTAPSPTPMAMRPKITIPDSSVQKRSRSRGGKADSATSVHSNNVLSPTESTPLPGKTDVWGDSLDKAREKRIYGGQVSIAYVNEASTPVTALSDVPLNPSPWATSSSDIPTKSAQPRSFHGDPAIPRVPQESQWNQNRSPVSDDANLFPARLIKSNQAHSQPRSPENARQLRAGNQAERSGRDTYRSVQEQLPGRPSSPKSRNASRSREGGPLGSAGRSRSRTHSRTGELASSITIAASPSLFHNDPYYRPVNHDGRFDGPSQAGHDVRAMLEGLNVGSGPYSKKELITDALPVRPLSNPTTLNPREEFLTDPSVHTQRSKQDRRASDLVDLPPHRGPDEEDMASYFSAP